MNQRSSIVSFVRDNFDEEFDPGQDGLLDIMDSVSFLQLVVFIEQEFGIRLDMSTMTLESFASVDALIDTLSAQ